MTKRRSTPLNNPAISGHHCTREVRMEKLGMVPFFRSISSDALLNVEKKFNATHFSQGDAIYFQDERATLLRVLVHGKVKLLRQTLDGKDILLDMLNPGEFFGSLRAFGDEVYTDAAIAQTDACILSIGLREFRSILEENPDVAVAVLDITADRLHSSRERIRRLTTLSVEKRIANILITLCAKFGEESKYRKLLQLPLSRKDLADMSGTSTETASRIMSRFQQDGI
ncbi:MAG TPA: Crp/Fnr family transcriptional regulator, partial [Balneolales bacterium]|nr:Crp/Fnr family transcriptional regulator [Balneolales bacterium]